MYIYYDELIVTYILNMSNNYHMQLTNFNFK